MKVRATAELVGVVAKGDNVVVYDETHELHNGDTLALKLDDVAVAIEINRVVVGFWHKANFYPVRDARPDAVLAVLE